MELSKQCITLEQAKQLKELWFQNESYAIWCHEEDENNYKTWETVVVDRDYFEYCEWSDNLYNAYTVSELMEYLPHQIWKDMLHIEKVNTDDWVFYFINCWHNIEIVSENLAQALWDMLIYLIENKYIEI